MPGSNSDFTYMPARELCDLIATKKVSPVELVEFTLDRIEKLNGKLAAYITVRFGLACHPPLWVIDDKSTPTLVVG